MAKEKTYPAYVLPAIGTEAIAVITCDECGAAIIVEPEETSAGNAKNIRQHERWHRKVKRDARRAVAK